VTLQIPRSVLVIGAVALAAVGIDAGLGWRWWQARSEMTALRGTMTDVEKRRADLAIRSDAQRLALLLEKVRQQALADSSLHLSIAVDSGTMYLERDAVSLRDMHVEIGPGRRVGSGADTVHLAVPRGERTIERILGPKDAWDVPAWVFAERKLPVPANRGVPGALGVAALVLSGGTVVYTLPTTGPLADSAYVLPGAVRSRTLDLKAIAPNLVVGQTVYFY
jgi:hypothetical protein